MNRSEEDLAKLLAEHAAYETDEDDHARCVGCGTLVCGQYAPHSIGFMTDDEGFRAHQAEVIAAAGWLRGELDYRVWIERDPHQSGGLDLEEASGSGYWFPIKNLNVAKHREKHPEARIEKRFIGATDWEEA